MRIIDLDVGDLYKFSHRRCSPAGMTNYTIGPRKLEAGLNVGYYGYQLYHTSLPPRGKHAAICSVRDSVMWAVEVPGKQQGKNSHAVSLFDDPTLMYLGREKLGDGYHYHWFFAEGLKFILKPEEIRKMCPV
jgi:hypothetical protein